MLPVLRQEVDVSDVFACLAMLGAGLAFGLLITQLSLLATTVFLHRYLAHGAIELRREVRAASRIWIWITTALKPRQWAQVHRYHHATEDTPEDPHSPRNFGASRRGAWYVFWHNGPLYTRATGDGRLALKYQDLRADRWDRWFFDHGEVGLVVGISLACLTMACVGRWLMGGWLGMIVGVGAGLCAAGFHMAYYILAGGAINGFGHAGPVGRPDTGYAVNMRVISWLTAGEGWHRNHHAAENSPRLGWGYQVDLGWLAICGLRRVGLARLTTRGEAGLHRLQTFCTRRALGTT